MPESDHNRLFPLFADLRDRTVVVVGGGLVAARKVEALLGTGARIVVVAPALGGALAPLAADGRIDHRAGTFAPEALDDAWLAIAATDDPQVNRAVAEAGQARRVWVNVVDDAELARVHLPARVERGPLQVAISSGGGAPMLARLVREQPRASSSVRSTPPTHRPAAGWPWSAPAPAMPACSPCAPCGC